MRSISSTAIVSFIDNEFGHLVSGAISSVGSGLPTTASTFAHGAEIVDRSTGLVYRNVGTVAVPVWVENDWSKVSVTLAAADLIAMYATPVVIIPAITNRAIIVDSVDFDITRTSTAFTGGGVVAVQYDSTANGAGTATTATIAASVVTGAAGRTITGRIPVVQSDIASASIVGKGLYISNQTAAFAAGTGTAVVTVRYHLL